MVHCSPMLSARPAAAPTLYDGGEFDVEFERVLRIGNPGNALRRALTFLPPADASADEWFHSWEAWQRGTLAVKLNPVLVSAAGYADRGAAREIQSLDLELDAILEPDARERSTVAGKRLLAQLAGARGERWLTKLYTWSVGGTMPTHFLTVYATQSALFHLSLRLLLPGYAYWEWTAAMQTCLPLGGCAPEFARAVPGLRQLVQLAFSSHAFHAVPTVPFVAGAS